MLTRMILGSLRNENGDGNENGKKKKAIGLDMTSKTTLHVHHAFCTFLCRRGTTTTWNCLISRFVKDGNKRQLSFFFSWTLMQSFRIQLKKNLPTFDKLNEMEKA